MYPAQREVPGSRTDATSVASDPAWTIDINGIAAKFSRSPAQVMRPKNAAVIGASTSSAAIVAASGLIIAATTDGELIVMRQGRTAFVLVRKYTLADSPVWAHPAFTRDGILRGERAMRERWWDALGLGSSEFWRMWTGAWSDPTPSPADEQR